MMLNDGRLFTRISEGYSEKMLNLKYECEKKIAI